MAKYRITTDKGTYEITTDDGGPSKPAPAQPTPTPAQPPNFLQALPKAAQMAQDNPAFAFSPPGLALKAQSLIQQGADKLGNFVTDQTTRALQQPNASIIPEQARPYLAAGAGTVVKMAPDIISAAAQPVDPKATTEAAVPFARRALGNTYVDLKTPAARLAANDAARVALQNDVIPQLGNADTMLQNAQGMTQKFGQSIGNFLKSQGKSFDAPGIINDLNQLRQEVIPPAVLATKAAKEAAGEVADLGHYQGLYNQIDDAIKTIQAHGTGPMSFEDANGIKGLLQSMVNYSSPQATQTLGKQIAGTAKQSVDSQLEKIASETGTAPEFKTFLESKRGYGAGENMQGTLNKLVGRKMGNNAVSPTATATAIGGLVGGGPVQGAVLGAIAQALKTRGNAFSARAINDTARYAPLMMNPIADAMIRLKDAMAKKKK